MDEYDLKNTDLTVRQSSGSNNIDFTSVQKGYAQIIEEKNTLISQLRSQIKRQNIEDTISVAQITRECGAIVDGIRSVSMSRQNVYTSQGRCIDTVLVCVIAADRQLSNTEMVKLKRWLQIRGATQNVKIYVE